MSGYQSTLLGRTEVAKDTMAFQFKRPNDFVFKAGQYIDLTLSGSLSGSSSGTTHIFSIASSPFDEDVVVTTPHAKHSFQAGLIPSADRCRGED